MPWRLSQTSWALAKDIILTGGGLVLIGSQVFSAHPSSEFIIAGLAMTGIGASFHVGAILGGFLGRSSSPAPEPKSSPPPPGSSSSPEH